MYKKIIGNAAFSQAASMSRWQIYPTFYAVPTVLPYHIIIIIYPCKRRNVKSLYPVVCGVSLANHGGYKLPHNS